VDGTETSALSEGDGASARLVSTLLEGLGGRGISVSSLFMTSAHRIEAQSRNLAPAVWPTIAP
jgi:hypothetical protein